MRIIRGIAVTYAALLGAAGCAELGPPGPDLASTTVVSGPLEYTARAELLESRPQYLHVAVSIVNVSSEPVSLEWGGCGLQIEFYSRPERMGHFSFVFPGYPVVCAAYLATRVLKPGDTLRTGEFNHFTPVPAMTSGGLADGRYFLSALVQTNKGLVVVPAGNLEFIAEPPGFPSERMANGILYSTTTYPDTTVEQGMVLRITLTNVTADRLPIGASRSRCAVSLSGSRDPITMERVYSRTGFLGEWYPPSPSCLTFIPSDTLRAGETRTYETSFGEPPAEIRYFLLQIVPDQSTSTLPRFVLLSAGSR